MTDFREGDFILHENKGYGFLLEGSSNGWEVFHPTSYSNPRIDSERLMRLADRGPTDAELCEFVKWRLTK